ncbi:MAG TPA: polyprenyl synthetase family protein [Mycobacteriales bacterium]|jgi:heptaprenyl diphosphate synthase|nr:polyprenyl synthetase family protein [Mycobacteriales bacterium]
MTAANPIGSNGSGIDFNDPELEAAVRSGLDSVEGLLRDSVKSDYPFVTETSQHLVAAGGKRFRPLVVLLAAQFGDPASQGVVPSAVVVELTHLATLYHDDVMDEAVMRRGAVSANSRWGNTVAILTGDFLFARASDILADLGPEAVRLQARTFERLVQGQIRETVGPTENDDPVEHYLRVVADKTGSLIGTSGRFGAMLAGADEAAVEVLTRFGERIGVAFQLSDDLLDVTSESAASGKTPGTDLREGVPTLPVLLLRRRDDAADADLLEALGGDLSADSELRSVVERLRAHPVMVEARAVVQSWADDARATLEPLPDVPAKAALESLCDFVVRRTG